MLDVLVHAFDVALKRERPLGLKGALVASIQLALMLHGNVLAQLPNAGRSKHALVAVSHFVVIFFGFNPE